MPTPEGVWTEYSPAHAITEHSDKPNLVEPPKIIRPFSSEIAAYRAANPNGNRVVFVRFGESIDEALAREDGPAPAPVPTIKRRTAAERRAAAEDMAASTAKRHQVTESEPEPEREGDA